MRGVTDTMRSAGLALSLTLLLIAPVDAAPNSKICAAPHELRQLRGGLARTATRLARQEPLTIVAIGSSSTFGYGASSLALSYPSQLAVELRRRIPAETIDVHNEGVSGETSIEMLERFDRDVFAHQPDLVIWQVGTNAVLHDFEIGHYRQVVRDGVERLKNAGIDVIIMDMQFAPKVLAHPLYREMEHSLRIGPARFRDNVVGRWAAHERPHLWLHQPHPRRCDHRTDRSSGHHLAASANPRTPPSA